MPIGHRVHTHVNRPDPELVKRFACLSTPDIADAMNNSYTLDRAIRPVYTPIKRVAGPAITVSSPTASLAVLKIGLSLTQPGDIVVANAQGNLHSTLVGGNICRGLVHRGLAGLVLDGSLRDPSQVREDGLPVWSRGITTAGGPMGPNLGEVNVPIACGGVVVNPGDIVVADEDGVVVVPVAEAEYVLAATLAIVDKHEQWQELLLRGEVTGIAAIEADLRSAGCEFID